MSDVRKTIALTEAQNDWIKTQPETAEIDVVRAALIEGETSGRSKRGPEDIRAAVKQRRSRNA
jgi:hypothetical protein